MSSHLPPLVKRSHRSHRDRESELPIVAKVAEGLDVGIGTFPFRACPGEKPHARPSRNHPAKFKVHVILEGVRSKTTVAIVLAHYETESTNVTALERMRDAAQRVERASSLRHCGGSDMAAGPRHLDALTRGMGIEAMYRRPHTIITQPSMGV